MLTKRSILSGLFSSSVISGTILQLNNFHQLPLLFQVSIGEWFNSLCTRLNPPTDKQTEPVWDNNQHPNLSLPYSQSDVLDPIPEWSVNSAVGSKSQRSGKRFTNSGKSNINSRLDWYDNLDSKDGSHRYASIEGSVIQVSSLFACILIGNSYSHPIPQQLEVG